MEDSLVLQESISLPILTFVPQYLTTYHDQTAVKQPLILFPERKGVCTSFCLLLYRLLCHLLRLPIHFISLVCHEPEMYRNPHPLNDVDEVMQVSGGAFDHSTPPKHLRLASALSSTQGLFLSNIS